MKRPLKNVFCVSYHSENPVAWGKAYVGRGRVVGEVRILVASDTDVSVSPFAAALEHLVPATV